MSLVIHRIKELCRWSLTINANIKKFFYEKFFVIHRIKELYRWSLTINANIKKFFYEKFFGGRLFSDGELVFSVVTANFRED